MGLFCLSCGMVGFCANWVITVLSRKYLGGIVFQFCLLVAMAVIADCTRKMYSVVKAPVVSVQRLHRNQRGAFKIGRLILYVISIASAVQMQCTSAESIHLRDSTNIDLVSTEYTALQDFYEATNGPNWFPSFGAPWNFSTYQNPCTDGWAGIQCDLYSNGSSGFQYSIIELFLEGVNLNGTLPTSIGNFTHMQYLFVAGNILTGSLPATIGDLAELTTLMVDDNHFTGTIPSSIGKLTNLTELLLFNNYFSGLLPESISNLNLMATLLIYNNHLSGSIPSNIGDLALLTDFEFNDNLFSGAIPDSMGNLVNIYFLMCQNNRFSGPLPASLANLSQLMIFWCSNNHLTGQLPDTIGSPTYTYIIRLYQNYLSGPIPPAWGKFQSLNILNLTSNVLTGSIPASIMNLTVLSVLYLADNLLTGEIPPQLGNFLPLYNLDLSGNKLSGSLPCSLVNITFFDELNLGSNHLNGTLPACVTQMRPDSFILKDNRFTGTIPAKLSKLTATTLLDLSDNQLSGTIPASLPEDLAFLYLGGNLLTGSLPKSLSGLRIFQGLDIRNNHLSGTLDGIFNGSATTSLSVVQLDNNPFTGTLPGEIFDLPALTTFTVVNSCFHGSLPKNLCVARQLETLILFGIGSGKSCSWSSDHRWSIQATNSFQSHLDNCVLELPLLFTLILSANSLTGRLTENLTLSDRFLELELAHNLLSGSIPAAIQNTPWYKLDLSHNKFVGALSADLFRPLNASIVRNLNQFSMLQSYFVNPQRTVYLDNNRLAGTIPNTLHNVSDIEVLAGNLFECSYTKTQLPNRDPDSANYDCASNSFDYAFYAWLGLVVVSVCIGYLVWQGALLAQLSMVIQVPDSVAQSLSNLFATLEAFQQLLKWSTVCKVYIVLVLTPYYVIISHYAGTHGKQYAYTVSVIFTSGIAPFVLNIVLWGLLLCILFVGLYSERQKAGTITPIKERLSTENRARAYVILIYGATNIVLVTAVNVLFVWVKLTQSTQWQQFSQIALAAFKLVWNQKCAPYMLRWLTLDVQRRGWTSTISPHFALQLVIALFNIIAIPLLVVMASDPNCFYEILLRPEENKTQYPIATCQGLNPSTFECGSYAYSTAFVQTNPPFTYSYQCSSSFITFYAPTFVYTSLQTVFVTPMLQYLFVYTYTRAAKTSWLYWAANKSLSTLLKPIKEGPVPGRNWQWPLFDAHGLLVTLFSQLCVLLTFGAAFTPIAVAVTLSLWAMVYMARFKLQFFVKNALSAGKPEYLEIINAECLYVGTRDEMQLAANILMFFCCAFFTLFLFDTLGDTQGLNASVWVLVVIPLLPFGFYGMEHVRECYLYKTGKNGGPSDIETSTDDVEGVELGTVSALHKHVSDDFSAPSAQESVRSTKNVSHTAKIAD